jgi:CRP-like cAMP-binding protein
MEKHEPKSQSASLSIAERESIIAHNQLFFLLNPSEIHELALLMKEKIVEEGEVITRQEEVVDHVYLIISGTAEVTRTVTTMNNKHDISVAILKKNDSIGLSTMGIYSHSGMRTATVIARSPMTLLSIDLRTFNQFLQRPDVAYPALQSTTEKILLIQFIHETHLFSHLKKAEIQNLAHNIKKIFVKKNTVLFNEGDEADNCYFILSGTVRISTLINNIEKIISILQPSSLFGESAMLDSEKRNATAVADTDSNLFVINKSQLDLKNQYKNFINTVSETRIQQIRPAPLKNARIRNIEKSDGEKITLLYNQEKELRLSKLESEVWSEMNSVNTLADIFHKKKIKYNELTIDKLYQIILKMKQSGMIDFKEADKIIKKTSKNFVSRIKKMLRFLKKEQE